MTGLPLLACLALLYAFLLAYGRYRANLARDRAAQERIARCYTYPGRQR